jgi:NCS2 family nucleobase:cation symporter-2
MTASKAPAAAGKAPDARKAANVVYGVLDVPPLGVTALSGIQHVGLMSVYLVYPVLLAEAAGASSETAAAMTA